MEPTPHFATILSHAASQRTRMVNSLAAHQLTCVEQMAHVSQRLLEGLRVIINACLFFVRMMKNAASQKQILKLLVAVHLAKIAAPTDIAFKGTIEEQSLFSRKKRILP